MNLHAVVKAANTAADQIQSNLLRYRAPLKTSTMFTSAGRTTLHHNGEQVIYGPNGAVIGRVVEDPFGNCQIEEEDRLHAVIRPATVTKSSRTLNP